MKVILGRVYSYYQIWWIKIQCLYIIYMKEVIQVGENICYPEMDEGNDVDYDTETVLYVEED